MEILLQHQQRFGICEHVVESAASNATHAVQLMELLLLLQDDLELTIGGEAVLTAASHTGQGSELMEIILQHEPDIVINDWALQTAAMNPRQGSSLIAVLLQNRPNLEISEQVMKKSGHE